MPTLTIFDPPMCCSTGVCGVNVDTKLSQLAADVAYLKTVGVTVERHNLGSDPAAFTRHPEVLAQMGAENEHLPIFMVDGKIVSRGNYPERVQLCQWVGVSPAPPVSGGGCGPSCCCGN